MNKYLKLMRVKHYLKNCLIFLPLIFSGQFFVVDKLLSSIWGFISFSLMASATYIINDICDIENDKKHEIKKERPIASGAVLIKNAIILAIGLVIISIVILIYVNLVNGIPYILFLLPIFVQKRTGNFVHDMPNIVSKTCWGKPQGFNAHVFQGE